MSSSTFPLKGFSKLVRHRADRNNGLLFRPFSMAFWLCVFVLAFVCAMPFLPVSGGSVTPGFVRIVEGAVEDGSPQSP
jgi:hypothetical protein